MLMSSICQRLQQAPLKEMMPLTLAVACANVYDGRLTMARRDAVVQPYQFDEESDPEGEASEEIQTLWLQQDVSEWLVCLNNVSLFVCVVTVTTMKLMLAPANSKGNSQFLENVNTIKPQ